MKAVERSGKLRLPRTPLGLLTSAALAAAIVLAIALAYRATRRGGRGTGAGYNVLLITLDTTRADNLGCYGNGKGLTPNIDGLAQAGTVFEQCAASAPITLPSHATILTGLYPFVHGVRHNTGSRLAEINETMAEVLRQAGYTCGGYVAAMVLNRDTGLDQGFDTYDDVGSRHERPASEMSAAAIAWLNDHASDTFFLWVHYFDPHAPYQPPAAYAGSGRTPYEGEVAFTDAEVGRLLEALDRLQVADTTLVVLTADHGEGLGEHGEETHLNFVYDTTMSVPLVLRAPGRIPAGKRVAGQVRNADIAPTILSFVGMKPGEALPHAQGIDLMPRMAGRHRTEELAAYGESLSGWRLFGTSALRCLRKAGWKYIHAPRPELYHVAIDPGETTNLAADQPGLVETMRDELRRMVLSTKTLAPTEGSVRAMDRDDLDNLASIGYVRAAVDAAPGAIDDEQLLELAGPDPKDHVGDFAALSQAVHHLQADDPAEAEALYGRLVERFPDQAELRMQWARAMFLQGELDEAIEVFRTLCDRDPRNAEAHYGLGKLLQRAGRSEEAAAAFRAAVEADPRMPAAHYDLGVSLLKQNRIDEAIESFRDALAARPTYVDALVNLGVCLVSRDQPTEAIAHYRKALEIAPDDAGIHFNLGNVLLRAGDRTGAIAAYETALRLDPRLEPARQMLDSIGVRP